MSARGGGGGFVWFKKCTLLTAGSSPRPRRGRTGERAAENDSCGWGQRERLGAGEPARVPLSFGTKESLSLRHLSLPGRPRKRGAWGRGPEESLCAPGPSGRPSVSRASSGGSAQRLRQGAANMESGRRAAVGGRCGGGSPAPSPPPSGRVRSTKPSAQARPAPRPEESVCAERRGKGVETKVFPAPGQTREFSFFQSPRPTGTAGPPGDWITDS